MVKSDTYKGKEEESTSSDGDKAKTIQDAKNNKEQDHYVLSKLFKKSGVHSAVKHDMIVEGGGADFALIEGEAERVAKDAVHKLRESRRLCFRAESGLPTWTGNNGVMAQPKKRFGKKEKTSTTSAVNERSAAKDKITAQELLQRMRRRNGVTLGLDQNLNNRDEDPTLFQPDSMSNNVDLLTDIRNFIAFQCQSANDGEATTSQLLDKFKEKLPPKQNPLFKALLTEICIMYRDSKRQGVWKLKPEFR